MFTSDREPKGNQGITDTECGVSLDGLCLRLILISQACELNFLW